MLKNKKTLFLSIGLISSMLSLPLFASEKQHDEKINPSSHISNLRWVDFNYHCYRLTGTSRSKKSLLFIIFKELWSAIEVREELDQYHMKQVEIFFNRIPSGSKIWSKYSKARIAEGLHMLVAKYNIDVFSMMNSDYAQHYPDVSGTLEYLNNLELELLVALDFSLHIEEKELL